MQQSVYQWKIASRKSLALVAGLCLAGLVACAGGGDKKDGGHPAKTSDAASQLKLPAGFSAVTVVENFGKTRHIAVAPNRAIFVKLNRLKDGKGIYRLMDTNGDGKADKISGFGSYTGTGMA